MEHSIFAHEYEIAHALIRHLKGKMDPAGKKLASGCTVESWEGKLLTQWIKDPSPKKLPFAKWNVETLLGYSADVQQRMLGEQTRR